MKVVEFDERSPFYGLVNLTEKKTQGKIGYKTMVRVAKAWYSAAEPWLKNSLLPQLFPHVSGKGQKAKRTEAWKLDIWGEFFLDFWLQVKDRYLKFWEVGSSNLTIAVVLLELQQAFFNDLNYQDEEFFETQDAPDPVEHLRAKLRKRAQKVLEYFPDEFFQSTWKIKSLNTGAGRVALQDALSELLKTKGKYQFSKSLLFTGKVS